MISQQLRWAVRDLRRAKRKGLPPWVEAFVLDRLVYARKRRDESLRCRDPETKRVMYTTAARTVLVMRDLLGFYLCDGQR